MSRPRNHLETLFMISLNRSFVAPIRSRGRRSDFGDWLLIASYPIRDIKALLRKEGFSSRDLREILDDTFPRIHCEAGGCYANRASYFVRRVQGVRCIVVSYSGGRDI